MGTIRCEIIINKPVETVYDYFANPDRDIARATPEIESVERLSPGPTAPGTIFRFLHAQWAGARVDVAVHRRTTPARAPVRGSGRAASAVEPADLRGSRRRNDGPVRRAGPIPPVRSRLLAPLASMMGRRLWHERLAKAKAFLEAA